MTAGHGTDHPVDTDVVVCGSGVAGLAAACALGRLGLKVILADKRPTQPSLWKGEVLQPGSLDSLHAWGALGRLEARQAIRLSRLVARTADGEELMAMDFAALGGERPWMLAHDYSTILECMAESLGPTVSLRRGVLIKDLGTRAGGRICGVRAMIGGTAVDIRARLVVAADGMSSRLRRLAGIDAEPVAYDHRLLSFELSGTLPVDDEVSAHVTDRGLVMVYPLPDARIRVYVQVRADELRQAGPAELRRWCEGLVDQVPALDPIAKLLEGNLERRQLLPVWRYRAPSLVRPGIVLLGEAAHVVHPLAAQGMNTSIDEAKGLAARLAAVDLADDAAVDRALRGYEDDRMARIRAVHTMSHNAARMMTSTSRGGRVMGRRLMRGTARSSRLSYLTTYNMSGLGMRPLGRFDRLVQLGVVPDLRARSFAPRDLPGTGAGAGRG
ncbi:FAD-dependent oxidoreductase [Streptomyces rishiriensis]|uniref:2-polyprenyl-6-methoxyphenol hydroxylase-like FAD-dependent oxidoreductase n=1 Tax=Streptomyces rishiriensis TaxID=68264 RepID=A0ABU0P3W3_STRRH|nr:NAD(P)/FAD-dependent oxidoreductase [Streptomyces rishiriensis]MDQ0585638.1 2-polyprenyl-6-methoxyphenol hydroxylase-like FAD-dependent oxidoreductase [Streptomyces rishiriensis]